MFIKLLACGVIMTTTAKIGLDIAKGYGERIREIRALQSGLRTLRSEISFRHTVLSDGLKSASNVRNKQIAKVFQCAADTLVRASDQTFEEAWGSALAAYKPILALKRDETEVLLELGRQLGTGTIDDMVCLIRRAEEQLELCERAAVEEERRYGKLYRSLGFMAGIFLTIIFI